ncbi:site-2 protease family protein [Butyrivibrio sp. MC2013]|uniref:site-2 protease family protein n=1 Tax=Butyrivibrio sp. MC2013 TaxID=1280686 RepID=UPI000406F300|nr:site-2 protease family protein [Butyrivibrio sp. MC2013]
MNGLPRKKRSIELVHKGNSKCVIFDTSIKYSYVVGINECDILFMLNGQTSVRTIAKRLKLTEEYIVDLIKVFESKQLLEDNDEGRQFKFKLNSVYITLLKTRESTLCSFNMSIIDRIIDLITIFSAAACALLFLSGGFRHILLIDLHTSGADFFIAFILVFITIIFHELSHSIAAKSLGAFVVEYGIVISYGIPYFYTSICGMKLLPVKARIKIYSAGIRADMIFMNLALLIYAVLFNCNSAVVLLFVLLEYCSICMNAVAFVKSDGKCVFKELVNLSGYSSLLVKMYSLFKTPVVLCLVITFGYSMINIPEINKMRNIAMILKSYPIIICLSLMALLSLFFYLYLFVKNYSIN